MKTFEDIFDTSQASPYCAFGYYSSNLGDHIQTLALLQHVRVRELIPRDHLEPRRQLCLVANGWLSHGPLPRRGDFHAIRCVGVHIDPSLRTAATIDTLSPLEPIGCRDSATAAFLTRHGVAASLTGCATLTFPRHDGSRLGVLGVDIPTEYLETVRQRYPEIQLVTHFLPKLPLAAATADVIRAQFKAAYDMLMRYRSAELVVTSRVHAALPSAAFGTPVIYLGIPRAMDDRVAVLDGAGIQCVDRSLRWLPRWALRMPSPPRTDTLRERYLTFLQRALNTVSPESEDVSTSSER